MIPSNFEIMTVIEKYYNCFFIEGSIFLSGIEKALYFDNIEINQTNIQKILIYINNSLIQQAEDRKNG